MRPRKTKTGRWQVRFRYGDKMPGPTFESLADAEDYATYVRRCLDRGEPILLPKQKMGGETLSDFFATWLGRKRNLQQRTRDLYQALFERHALEQMGSLPLRAITVRVMDDWQAERLAEGAGPDAIAKTGKMLHQVFKQAVRYELMDRNPAASMERPRAQRKRVAPASPMQVETMRAYFLAAKRPGEATLVSVLAYGGLRVGEALALNWDDFIHGSKLYVAHSLEDDGSLKSTKTGEVRTVDLPKAVAKDLLVWRRQSRAEGLIFPRVTRRGAWTINDRNNWRRRSYADAIKAAGLKAFPPKDLRHTCASLMVAAGRPSTEVAVYLGHSLATSIGNYQHLVDQMRGQPLRSVDDLIEEARQGTLKAQTAAEQMQAGASRSTEKADAHA